MEIFILLIASVFIARLFYVLQEAKRESRRKSSLNKEIYSHAYRLGLNYNDLREFDINPAAKKKLKESLARSRNLYNAEGKTEALQIAEAAVKVVEERRSNRTIREMVQESKTIDIGDIKIYYDGHKPEYNKVVSAVFSGTYSSSRYKGQYLFLISGAYRLAENQEAISDNPGIEKIHEIEYVDGLRIARLDSSDDVREFIERTATPIVREIFGEDKALSFSDDVLRLYISMATSMREKNAEKAMLIYMEEDNLEMLMRWIKPFDDMLYHMPDIANYINSKGIKFEENEDSSQGFYRFY